jgi:hypothetical protein
MHSSSCPHFLYTAGSVDCRCSMKGWTEVCKKKPAADPSAPEDPGEFHGGMRNLIGAVRDLEDAVLLAL